MRKDKGGWEWGMGNDGMGKNIREKRRVQLIFIGFHRESGCHVPTLITDILCRLLNTVYCTYIAFCFNDELPTIVQRLLLPTTWPTPSFR